MSQQTLGSDGTPLPVQVLTLQASNMTLDDLLLAVLAPASFTPSSVVSLNNSPSSPLSPFSAPPELSKEEINDGRGAIAPLNQREKVAGGPLLVSVNQQTVLLSDVAPIRDLGCTHLWLQCRVPLGCVPSQSTATVKLEVLPLTDGIITLDTLQVEVKEKGLTYIPEQFLKIDATSSIATGVL